MTNPITTLTRQSRRLRTVAAVSVLLSLAGCGAGGDAVLTAAPGALTLTIDGLIDGVTPAVELVGPNGYQKTIRHSGTIEDLDLGTYQIQASPTTAQSTTWSPTSATQSITLSSGAPAASAVVRYQLATGALDLRIEGLPASTGSAIHLSGPAGFALDLASTAVLRGLAPGNYTLSAASRTIGTSVYFPADSIRTVSVAASLVPATTTFTYSRAMAALEVIVSGLPAGALGQYSLTGPGSYSSAVSTASQFDNLDPGSYVALPLPIVWQGHTWSPVAEAYPVAVNPGTNQVEIPYTISTGALDIEIDGLPSGAQAQYTITGPGGFTQGGDDDLSLVGLWPGTYTVTATAVIRSGRQYKPRRSSQTITMTPGLTPKHGKVEYSAESGAIAMTIAGLPGNLHGRVIVRGASSIDTLGATETLDGLAPDTYQITAETVSDAGMTYTATPVSQSKVLAAGDTVYGSVVYAGQAPTTGALALAISGLPSGAAAALTVSGPNGFSATVTAGTTLDNLVAGTYTISAQPVTISGTSYTPTPASQTASVTGGSTANRAVSYAATGRASLQVVISGLPSGQAGDVDVQWIAGGYAQHVTTTTTLSDLGTPGTYVVTAHAVTIGGQGYAPVQASQSAYLTTGSTASKTVTYQASGASTGALSLSVVGLPSGTAGAITVTGPSSYSQAVTATGTLSNLAPGTYTITAQAVTSGGTTYNPAASSQTVAVTAGATATKSVSYSAAAPTTGTLAVSVSGLPGGAAASIAISGPGGFSQSLTGSASLPSLVVGTYTITAQSVTVGGSGYAPTPTSQTASVTAGGTVSRSVAYAAVPAGAPATVTVDTTVRFQTMSGWEATAQIGQTDFSSTPWSSSVADLAANDLGINRVRLEVRAGVENDQDYFALYHSGALTSTEWRNHRYTPINDNANSGSINAAGFQFSEVDLAIDQVVLPMRQRLAARGEQLYVNLDYVAFNTSSGHLHSNPAEYAELMLATFQHIQSRYGFVPDAIEIILEPDNGTFFTGALIGQAIAATGARLAAAGFHPEFIGPSVMNMSNTVPFFDAIWAVSAARPYLSEVSYHRYAGVSDANLQSIGARAGQRGVRTAMLEHLGSGVEDLYKDLTLANVSGWSEYGLAYPTTSDNGSVYYMIQGNQPVAGSRTKLLRQYFQYVRRGAQRVQAASTSSGLRPVAFLNPGGGMAVVLHVDAAGSYSIGGLRTGNYEVTFTNNSGSRSTLPSVTATSGGTVTVSPTTTGVLTLSRVP